MMFPQYGQSFPDTYNPANPIQNDPRTGAVENDTLGYWNMINDLYQDSVYRLSYDFAHKGDLSIHFSANGLQAINTESWGIDDIEVRLTTAPAPTRTPLNSGPKVTPTPTAIPSPTPTEIPQGPAEQLFALSIHWGEDSPSGVTPQRLLERMAEVK
jgi:hypothetical protein